MEYLEVNKFTIKTRKIKRGELKGLYKGLVILDILDQKTNLYVLSTLLFHNYGFTNRYQARKEMNRRLKNWIIKNGISLSYNDFMEIKNNY